MNNKKVFGILATLFFTLVSIVFVSPIFVVLGDNSTDTN